MSIISGPVIRVSNVKILVSTVYPARTIERRDKTTGKLRRFKIPDGNPMQLTVYSNFVEKENSKDPVTMIIPFPMMQKTRRFKLLNLQHYPEILSDFNGFFSSKQIIDDSSGISWNTWDDDNDVQDFAQARYETHILSNFTVLTRYKKSLGIAQDVLDYVEQYYGKRYAFIVCTIDRTTKFDPIAYIHELMPGNKLFVPTRHIHAHREPVDVQARFEEIDEEVDIHNKQIMLAADKFIHHAIKRSSIAPNSMNVRNGWDHSIYVINRPDLPSNTVFTNASINLEPAKQNMVNKYKNFIKIANIPNEITFNGITNMFKIVVSSTYKINHDFIL
jgi:hypothetical protein